jgi:glycosyltransferase involved in cell wall biosynthesis
MPTPAVSICVPAYKAERYLAETLGSVRAQTFSDWELIVTEDGSRDRTETIVRDFAATVKQPVRYLRHDPNRGLPATRNAGFAAARAEWIALLDADDLWLPQHLAGLTDARSARSAQLAFAASQIFESETGVHLELRDATPDLVASAAQSLYAGKMVIQPSSVLFSRALLEKAGGFSSDFPICNDLEFWLRQALAGASFAYSGQATCLYRKHPDAMSTKSARLIAEVGDIRRHYLDRVSLARSEKKRLTAAAYWNAARIARSTEPRLALTCLLKTMKVRLGLS